MRALVVYSNVGKVESLAEGVAKGLREAAFDVDIREAEERGSTPISVAPYDVICVGSPVLGFFGGQVAADIDATVKRCTRMEGKQVAVFVKPKVLGTAKALRRLMGILEHQGAWVQDFAAVGRGNEAVNFGRRLDALAKKSP